MFRLAVVFAILFFSLVGFGARINASVADLSALAWMTGNWTGSGGSLNFHPVAT